MTSAELYAALCVLAIAVFLLAYTARGPLLRRAWIAPAALSAAFLAFSAYTIASEGLLPVWHNHTQNFWGNQVWFDLLIGLAISWVLILPRADRVGLRRWPWLVAVMATANIAMLAMLARVLYLEARSENA